MCRHDVSERIEDRFDPTGKLLLPRTQHRGNLLALQVLLRAAQRAGNERELHCIGIAREIALADVGQRADDDVTSVIGHELRRHRLQLAAEKKIEKKRCQHVVAVVPERDLRRAEFARNAIQNAPAQARAQRAHRAAGGNDALDDAVGVLFGDMERHAAVT